MDLNLGEKAGKSNSATTGDEADPDLAAESSAYTTTTTEGNNWRLRLSISRNSEYSAYRNGTSKLRSIQRLFRALPPTNNFGTFSEGLKKRVTHHGVTYKLSALE